METRKCDPKVDIAKIQTVYQEERLLLKGKSQDFQAQPKFRDFSLDSKVGTRIWRKLTAFSMHYEYSKKNGFQANSGLGLTYSSRKV